MFSAPHRWVTCQVSACLLLAHTHSIQLAISETHRSADMKLKGFIASVHSGLPLERVEQAVSPGVAARLQARGFAIVDHVFGGIAATALRQEIEALRQVLRHSAVLQEGMPVNVLGFWMKPA
jgi:hypothetical protein